MKVHSIDIKRLDSLVISSSEIKKLISKGNIDKVNKLLGRNYHISGKVIHGEKRGRLIGFPTTNLSTEWNFLPKKGVYVSKVVISDKSYQSITNIGVRPTFNANSLQIESHIFDFNKNVYGKKIKIYFLARIRSEKKFETVEKLIENINSMTKNYTLIMIAHRLTTLKNCNKIFEIKKGIIKETSLDKV